MAHVGSVVPGAFAKETGSSATLALWTVAIGTGVFAVFPTLPIFSDNQNTKFLSGLAKAGYGRLRDDWLVQQGSQFPLFDHFVALNQTLLGPVSFYLWQWLLVLVYTAAMLGLARVVGGASPSLPAPEQKLFWPILGAWFIALNATAATNRVFEGVAHHYVNGRELQPQSFGVLALLGLLLFRLGYARSAAVLIVATAWIHAAYVIPGVMLFLGMAVARWRLGRSAVPASPVLFALGIIGSLGSALFSYALMPPGDPGVQAEAARIIAEIRIPHHSLPAVWFDADAAIKLAIVLCAIALAWRDPVGWVLLAGTVLIAASSLWVYAVHDLKTALAAPWRTSAILVPAAVAILMGRLVQAAVEWGRDRVVRQRAVFGLTGSVLIIGATVGMWKKIDRGVRQAPGYFAWVRDHAQPGDVFLTPIDQMDFRLATGQPQYVTWKSNAHFGQSVLDWYARVERARAVTEAHDANCALLDKLAGEGVTHIVRRASQEAPPCPAWNVAFSDGNFTVAVHHEARATGAVVP